MKQFNKIDDKKIKDLIHSIGLNNYLRDDEIRKIVESQFRFTYQTIRELPLDDINDEQLETLKTNFTYKHIGKLYTSQDIIKRYKNKDITLKEKKNEQEEFDSSGNTDNDR